MKVLLLWDRWRGESGNRQALYLHCTRPSTTWLRQAVPLPMPAAQGGFETSRRLAKSRTATSNQAKADRPSAV